MARNRAQPVVGEYAPAPSPEGPIAECLRTGVLEYMEQQGGLALVELAARGAMPPSMLALISLALNLERDHVAAASKREPKAPRLLTAVPKTVLDGPLPAHPHERK